MTITEAIRTYKLPNPATQEDLEQRWSTVLNFGDKILVAGYFWNGPGQPAYFGAVYEYLDNGPEHDCESPIGIRAVSEVEFEDDGHAVAWGIEQ